MDGYFAPASAVRRIGGEAVLMLGGGRALLMQAAHPLVAAGIVDHSRYREDPWRRLARTMTALYTIVFGTKAEADRAGAVVQAVHGRVRGRLSARVGPYPAGTPYAASDPELMLWVHGTLVDTGIAMYERYVARLSDADKEAFYRDMKVVARVFGVPADILPRTLADFRAYERECVETGAICVGADALRVAETIVRPPVPVAMAPGFRLLGRVNVTLLPPPIRDLYGLGDGRFTGAAPVRTLLPFAPRSVRLLKPSGSRGRDGLPLALLGAMAR